MPRDFDSRAGAHMASVLTLLLFVLPSCGSTGKNGGASGAGGSDATGGSSTNRGGSADGGHDMTGDAGNENVAPGKCEAAAASKDGAVQSAISPQPSAYVSDVAAGCDGSFVVTGEAPLGITFDRADNTKVELKDATVWLAKYDARGELAFAKPIAQGRNDDSVWGYPAIFPDGSVVVGGVFGTSAVFGGGESNETTLHTLDARLDGFVARYTSTGALDWVQQIGPANSVYVSGVAAGPDGITYAAIHANNTQGVTLGPGVLDVQLAGGDSAIATLDAHGKFLAASLSSALEPQPMKLIAAADGGVIVAGRNYEDALVGKGAPTPKMLASPGLFMAHLSRELQLQWVRPVSVPTNTLSTALLPDGSGAFVGSFSTSLTLGKGEAGEVTFTNQGGEKDGFVARLDSEGKLAWAIQLASADDVNAYGVAAMADGSIWVSGAFGVVGGKESTLELASGTPSALSVSGTGSTNFVARFGARGNVAWATTFADDAYLHTQAMSASPGSLIAVGTFDGSATFGAASHQLTAKSSPSSFIARLGP
jgi:hypothetical protein